MLRRFAPRNDGTVKIGFYGSLGEAIGREVEVALSEACTVGELRAMLAGLYPDAAPALIPERARAVVDDRVVTEEFVLGQAVAVEFFPPLSGG